MKKRVLRMYYMICIWWCDFNLLVLHHTGKIVNRAIKWNKKFL